VAEQKRRLPWRVSSQFWVAFFGGVPAVTAIAFLNARRLGATGRKQGWILLAAVAAVFVYVALFAAMRAMDGAPQLMRIAGRAVAVALYLVLAQIQREDDGRHQVFGSGQYASLWIPGILATVLSAALLIGSALGLLRLFA
jgi:hypothetical protein